MSASARVRDHLRENVVGYVALFLALAIAPAWAATLTPNSVRSKHIRNGEVQRQDIAGNAVNGAKVAPDSLRGSDIDESTLALEDLPSGPPSGAAGGDLAGSYPNPELAASSVGGNEIANNSIPYIKLASPGTFHEFDIGLSFENSAIRWGIANNGVQAPEIADGAVGSAEIATNSVTGSRVSDRSLGGNDLGLNSVDGEEVVEITSHTSTVTVPTEGWGEATAICAGGDSTAISGGASWSGVPNESLINPYLRIIKSHRSGFAGWTARGYNGYTVDPLTLVVSVYCI